MIEQLPLLSGRMLSAIRRGIAWYVLLASLCLPGGAARAQDGSVAAFFNVWSSDRTLANLRKQAACAVAKYHSDSETVVLEDTSMQDLIGLMPKLAKPCYQAAFFKDNTFAITQPMYGFVLAEALIRQSPAGMSLEGVKTARPLPRQMIPQVDFSAFPKDLRQAIELTDLFVKLDAVADCAVRRASPQAYALVMSEPNSAAEIVTQGEMDASLQACELSSLAVRPPQFLVRGAIAYNLYRLLHADRVKSSEG